MSGIGFLRRQPIAVINNNTLRFALRKLRIRLWVIHVGFVVKIVTLERDLSGVFQFSCRCSILLYLVRGTCNESFRGCSFIEIQCPQAGKICVCVCVCVCIYICIYIYIYIYIYTHTHTIQFNPIQFSGYLLNFGFSRLNAENKASTKK